MAPIGTLYFSEQTRYKAEKGMVTAIFNGLELDRQAMQPKDYQNAAVFAGNPTKAIPCLHVQSGCLFTSNSIAKYLAGCRADTGLCGQSLDDESKLDALLDFATHELEVPLMAWVYPTLGLMKHDAKVEASAKEDVKKALAVLEKMLDGRKYLLGDRVTLADIVLVCVLKEGFTRVFEPSFRKPYPKVCAWFESCCRLDQFAVVLGKVTLCSQADKPKPLAAGASKAAPAAQDAAKDAQRKTSIPTIDAPESPVGKKYPKTPCAAKGEPALLALAKPAAAGSAMAALVKESREVAPVDAAAVKALAEEIRAAKNKLKGQGLDQQQINVHPEIQALVARLDALRSGGGADVAAIQAVGEQIRALRQKLQAQGLTLEQIFAHQELKPLLDKLNALKSGGAAPAAPAAASKPTAPAAAAAAVDEAAIKAVGDEIRALKERLKGEGLSGKKMNEHAEVKALVDKLNVLKAGGAAPEAKPAAAPAAAPAASGGDVDAEITKLGDEIRELKAKLKADGLSGKKCDNHPEVKEKVAKLQELKAKK